MKIERLELRAFGPFTDAVLDLSAGNPGLHIIYGPNEAGKSSALRAIHGLLFGIPQRSPDTFQHEARKLRIGGVLSHTSGRRLHFLRRKGRKDTLLSPDTKTGGALPDEDLLKFLPDTDSDTFARVYGIGHAELASGGREMLALKGLVGESLFAATVGGSHVARLLTSLDTEAAEIFGSKRNSTLRVLARNHTELLRERRNHQLSHSRWERIQADLQQAARKRDAVVAEEKDISRRLNRLSRIRQALKLIGKYDRADQRTAELRGVAVLPDEYSRDRRSDVQAALNQSRLQAARLRELLEGDGGLDTQVKQMSIEPDLLEHDETIQELLERRAVVRRAQADARKLTQTCSGLRTEATELMRDLRISEPLSDIEEHRLSAETQALIRNLASREAAVRERPRALGTRRRELERKHARVATELNQLGSPPDLGQLHDALIEAREVDAVRQQIRTAATDIATAAQRIQDKLTTLSPWQGDAEEAVGLNLPLDETIDRFRGEYQSLEQTAARLQREQNQLNANRRETERAITVLQETGNVPTEAELDDLREQRDAAWKAIRRRLSRKSAGPSAESRKAVDKYENSVRAVDGLSDRLRREADRVAQLSGHRAGIDAIDERLRRLADEFVKHRTKLKTWTREWRKLWRAADIAKPMSPDEMRGWVRAFREFQGEIVLVREMETRRDRLAEQYQSIVEHVAAVVQAGGVAPKPGAAVIGQAREMVDDERRRSEQRSALDVELRSLSESLREATQAEMEAERDEQQWRARWEPLMEQLGCAPDAIAEQANSRIDGLRRLFEIVRDIETHQKRIHEIEEDSGGFRTAVAALADRFLPLKPEDPEEAALELSRMLQTARETKARHDELLRTRDQARADLAAAETTVDDATRQLAELCELAGVKDIDALAERERESSDLGEARDAFREAEEQLSELAANTELQVFLESVRSHDGDELPVEIAECERRLGTLREERDQAVVRVNQLHEEAKAAGEGTAATEADERVLGVVSAMQNQATHYLRLRMASSMLRRHIEAHRAENEDPLLERAGTLFERMTCREFRGLRTDFEDDQPVIVGVRKSTEELVPVRAMSDGTRDQLFLALRLAYVERQLVRREPLPFIVDDILVHFDDTRSAATLGVLAELSDQTQVIFLTHHQHLVDLALDNLSAERCFVHHLDSRNRHPSDIVISPARPR